MTREQALRAIKHHEFAIERGSLKSEQHKASIRWYRELFDIPEPNIFGRNHLAINRAADVRDEQKRKEKEFKSK